MPHRVRSVALGLVTVLVAMAAGCITPSAPGVRYSTAAPSTVGDIYLPKGPSVGTIVFVHGGGFSEGKRSDVVALAGPLLSQVRRGWAVVSIDYRFDPFPAAVLDLAAAVRWVRSDAGRARGLSSARVVVAGHSAGGAIVADLALARNGGAATPFGSLPAVDGWISAGGLLDFGSPSSVDPVASWRTGGAAAASPISHVDAGDPPGLVIHGTNDRVVSPAHALRFVAWSRFVGYEVTSRFVNDRTPCSGHPSLCETVRPDVERFLDRIATT